MEIDKINKLLNSNPDVIDYQDYESLLCFKITKDFVYTRSVVGPYSKLVIEDNHLYTELVEMPLNNQCVLIDEIFLNPQIIEFQISSNTDLINLSYQFSHCYDEKKKQMNIATVDDFMQIIFSFTSFKSHIFKILSLNEVESVYDGDPLNLLNLSLDEFYKLEKR